MSLIKPKNRVYCPQLGRPKMLFESREKAERFMKFNSDELEELNGYAPKRAYYCTACGGWHLTHQEKHIILKPENKPMRDSLEVGIRYHLSEIMRCIEEGMICLRMNCEWTSILKWLRRALYCMWDLKTTPYCTQMLSVQRLLQNFTVGILSEFNGIRDEPLYIDSETRDEILEEWEGYKEFLGYLLKLKKKPDNPRLLYYYNKREELGDDFMRYINCIESLKKIYISKLLGNRPWYKSFDKVINKIIHEELVKDLRNLESNTPI